MKKQANWFVCVGLTQYMDDRGRYRDYKCYMTEKQAKYLEAKNPRMYQASTDFDREELKTKLDNKRDDGNENNMDMVDGFNELVDAMNALAKEAGK